MNLFLCGGGSNTQILEALRTFASKIDKSKPILYIPLAWESDNYDSCYEWFKTEIKYMQISKFDMVNSSKELSQKNFNDYSALFIGGGNTYKLLKEIKDNSNAEKIIKYLNENGTIFASSAGAIIFGKDINTCINDDDGGSIYELY